MPDGSVCKHRQACKKSGTTVENSQCGGAKNVTIVVPKQPAVPKETCHFGFHSITFDCNKPSSTVPPKPRPTTSKYEATPPAATTTSSSSVAVVSSSSATSPGVPVVTKPSTASSASASVTVPGGPSSVTSPSANVPVPSSSKATESSPVATESSTKATGSSPVATESSTKATESVPVPTQPVTSTYMTTSTIFSTSTIVSCSSGVSECPGASVTTHVTVPVSTTVCPVTETHTGEVPPTKPAEVPSPSGEKPSGEKPSTVETGSATAPASSGVSSSVPSPSGGKPSGDKPSTAETGSATVPATSATVPATSASTPAGPVETLPCPGIVPSCLNTWMFSVGCKDNSDSACYCPDATFTKNIVQCLAAHGESDEVISESIEYFKGICAPFVPENPAIVTETITYITVTPTPVPSAVYTTITAVVPGTGEAGGNSPAQSTVMTVPQVGFTTVTSDESSTEVAVVPGTYPAVPAPTPSATGAVPTQPGSGNGGAGPYPTLITTAKPTGTGALVPSAPAATQTAVVTAGAARLGSGLAVAAMVAFFAL